MEMGPNFEIIVTISRYLVGLNFFIFGLNGFFNWISLPKAEQKMENWVRALAETGFALQLIKVLEIYCGLTLLINFQGFLATLILAPIVLMVILSQIFLNGKNGYGITAFTLIPYTILIISYGHRLEFFLS
jgi:uncharacterized membrane protein YphA (DoxX/SURF4 family)